MKTRKSTYMITLSNFECIKENFARFILLYSVQKQNTFAGVHQIWFNFVKAEAVTNKQMTTPSPPFSLFNY